ncbi:MAG: C39 family peptidase [Parcubacteria group bacterium]
MSKKIFYLIILLPMLAGCSANNALKNEAPSLVVEKASENNVAQINIVENNATVSIPTESVLPEKINWPVAFAPQAPTGNWSLPYQETCEEASLILADKYFKNEKLDNAVMDSELLKLVKWETKTFGYYTDTNVEQVKQMAEQYFNLKAEISSDVSIENMKKQLAAGNLIIAPFAGRLLHNPNYSGMGPIYHFMLIRGYDEKYFYTNDVGTRKGDNYKYDYATIINAIHDLPVDFGGVFRPYDSDISDSGRAARMFAGEKLILIISKGA